MTCPTCGADHHAETAEIVELEAAAAEANADAAESYAEAESAREDEITERNADDNDTRERIAEIEAEAAVAIAEADAAADVAIAEADAAAEVAAAEAVADAIGGVEDEPDDEQDAGGDVSRETVDDEDGEPAAIPVEVPPQLHEDDEPAPARRGRRETAFRRHRRAAR